MKAHADRYTTDEERVLNRLLITPETEIEEAAVAYLWSRMSGPMLYRNQDGAYMAVAYDAEAVGMNDIVVSLASYEPNDVLVRNKRAVDTQANTFSLGMRIMRDWLVEEGRRLKERGEL